MAGETIIAVVGNLTADPELRSTKNGGAWLVSRSRPPLARSTGSRSSGSTGTRCSSAAQCGVTWRSIAPKSREGHACGRPGQAYAAFMGGRAASEAFLRGTAGGRDRPEPAVCGRAGREGSAWHGWRVWQSVLRPAGYTGGGHSRPRSCLRPTRGAPTRPRLPRRSARSDSLPNRNFRKPKDESWTSR